MSPTRARSFRANLSPRIEATLFAEFDLAALREYRQHTIWGNAFRRPHRYGALTSLDVTEPFVRKNAFGEAFERTRR